MQPLEPEPPARDGVAGALSRAWAGLACGVSGGGAALAWYALHSALQAEPWWAKFNVAAGPFFGIAVYHMGLSRATLCGAALLMLYYAAIGLGFGLLHGLGLARHAFTAGLLFATLAHLGSQYLFWPRLDPFARSWFTSRATLPAHLCLALALARWPRLRDTLQAEFWPPRN
jgi:hypothetical protein